MENDKTKILITKTRKNPSTICRSYGAGEATKSTVSPDTEGTEGIEIAVIKCL